MNKANPGDIVRITKCYDESLVGSECIVADMNMWPTITENTLECLFVTLDEKKHRRAFWLPHDCYEIVIRKSELFDRPKPGDIVVFTDDHGHKMDCIVVDKDLCPESLNDISECIWVTRITHSYQGAFWLRHDQYEVIRRNTPIPCPDCDGQGEIELFTSKVKCHCKS